MQLAENANAACCICIFSQLHGQTDGLRFFCANSYVIAIIFYIISTAIPSSIKPL